MGWGGTVGNKPHRTIENSPTDRQTKPETYFLHAAHGGGDVMCPPQTEQSMMRKRHRMTPQTHGEKGTEPQTGTQRKEDHTNTMKERSLFISEGQGTALCTAEHSTEQQTHRDKHIEQHQRPGSKRSQSTKRR